MLCCPNGSFLSGVLAELLGVLKNKEQLRALCTDSEPAVAEYLVLTSADFSTEVTSVVLSPLLFDTHLDGGQKIMLRV